MYPSVTTLVQSSIRSNFRQQSTMDPKNTNFSFEVQKFIRDTIEEHSESEYSFLKYYQNIVRKYILQTPSRGILCHHQMGLGKSILAVSIAVDMIDTHPVVILLSKSLQSNMRESIKKYFALRRGAEPEWHLGRLTGDVLESWIDANFSFVSLNASNMMKQMQNVTRPKEVLETQMAKLLGIDLNGKLLIVDEAHNLFRAIINGSQNGHELYTSIMKSDVKLLFLTGTPVTNDPFELVPCFNMLAGEDPLFPEDYSTWNSLYVGPEGLIANKEKFQNRVMGLVSSMDHAALTHYSNTTGSESEFPEELPLKAVRVPMAPLQWTNYSMAREKEIEEAKRPGPRTSPKMVTKPRSKASSSYRVKSRQISNYDPESRIQPKFEAIRNRLDKHSLPGALYSQFISAGLLPFSSYLKHHGWQAWKQHSKTPDGIRGGGSELPSVEEFLSQFASIEMTDDSVNSAGDDIAGGNTDNWDNTEGIHTTGAYETNCIGGDFLIDIASAYNVIIDPGSMTVDASLDDGSIFSLNDALFDENYQGGTSGNVDDTGGNVDGNVDDTSGNVDENACTSERTGGKPKRNGTRRFALITGETSISDREDILQTFNSSENAHGELIELLLLSSTGAEGLDLRGIRHIHAMEPYWNWSRLGQVFSRGIRNGSHSHLPPSERNVQPYVYIAVAPPNEGQHLTTDIDLFEDSIRNKKQLQSFTDALSEVSIECSITGRDCYQCAPTGMLRYTNDATADINRPNPCVKPVTTSIDVNEIVIDGKTYYYSESSDSIFGYKIYYIDPQVDSYRRIEEMDERFETILDHIRSTQ